MPFASMPDIDIQTFPSCNSCLGVLRGYTRCKKTAPAIVSRTVWLLNLSSMNLGDCLIGYLF